MQRLGWDPIVLPIYIHGAFLPLQRQQLYDANVTRSASGTEEVYPQDDNNQLYVAPSLSVFL